MRGLDRGTTAVVVMAVVAVTAGIGARTPGQGASQQRAFRSGTSAVAVDVSVRDRSRRPVIGLQAADFEIFDNGVRQDIADVSYGRLPIDVTVALDVSFSVTGALLDRLRRGVIQLMGDLGREDRLKLVLFNMRVSRAVDFTTDVQTVERAIRAATAGGSTALRDAVNVALVSGSAPDRRQLIVFFTDGSDSSSITTPAMLTSVAQRTRGTLAFVMPVQATSELAPLSSSTSGAATGTTTAATAPRGNTTLNPTTSIGRLTLSPSVDPLYATLAGETGGSILPVSSTTDLSAAFRRILEEFRSAYVVYYNARDVDRGGYHTLEVKVKRAGATVQARRGYFSITETGR